jgi:hypothetical protein
MDRMTEKAKQDMSPSGSAPTSRSEILESRRRTRLERENFLTSLVRPDETVIATRPKALFTDARVITCRGAEGGSGFVATSSPFDNVQSWRIIWTHDKRPGIALALRKVGVERDPTNETEVFVSFRSAKEAAFAHAVGALRNAEIRQDPDEHHRLAESRSGRLSRSRVEPSEL